MHTSARARPRVSWIEVAIVGVVLAVLAALVVPQFSEASTDPREKQLRMAVQIVQGQLEMYKAQHGHRYPSLAQFHNQMTLCSDSDGRTAAPGASGFDRGPYLRTIPVNPYSGTSDISSQRGGPSAWYYDEQTGQFGPNHAGMN